MKNICRGIIKLTAKSSTGKKIIFMLFNIRCISAEFSLFISRMLAFSAEGLITDSLRRENSYSAPEKLFFESNT